MIWYDEDIRQFGKKKKKMHRVKSMYSSWLWLVTKQHNTKGTSCSFLTLKSKKHISIQNSFVISKQNFYETIQRLDIKLKFPKWADVSESCGNTDISLWTGEVEVKTEERGDGKIIQDKKQVIKE